MTPEEKAKRYDEALARARKLQENSNGMILKKWLWNIFPELKESEDEKIRKALINVFATHKDYEMFFGASVEDICAWLEKQGKLPIPKLRDINEVVEPKFHEGDWVIYNNDICQIVKREEGCNILVTQFGVEKEPVNERNLSTAKLWDISDAREGDVLANDHHILILKELVYDWSSNGTSYSVKAYCGIKPNGNFEIGKDNWSFCGTLHIHPATKEQRDTLFAKMKKAGYAFNFEKKELKKLGQSEVTKTSDQEEIAEIPFGAKDSELQEATYYIPKGFHAEVDDDKVVIKKGEKPTAWSEENGRRIQRISDFIWKNRKGDTDDIYQQEQDVKWLKSLKDRVGCEANCTTTKEWSEEDEHRVKDTIYFLDTAKKYYASTVELDACIDWLKSLKQRIGG